MKIPYLAFSVIFLSCAAVYGQDDRITLPIKDGRLYYEIIDSSVKLTKEELFVKARTWLSNNFNSSRSVIDYEDREAGKIICKGNFSIKKTVEFKLDFTSKDNKYRIIIDDIRATEQANDFTDGVYDIVKQYELYRKGKKRNVGLENLLLGIDKAFNGIISSLQKEIKSSNSNF